MAVEHLNGETFDSYVAEGTVLVDFWAEWCGPCRMLGPIFEELSNEIEGVKFAKLDISANEAVAQKFGVMSIPTIILFKNGEEAGRMTGAVPKEHLKQWVEEKV
ncbi:thioredoxin [Candidatus Micrarchaeota archaeon]|nr:thioredoxin [Candidatus Micrarchaeota archaeon]MBD3417433.1 thioredoxin [Candidatus Micrarchaeota archaeon]